MTELRSFPVSIPYLLLIIVCHDLRVHL